MAVSLNSQKTFESKNASLATSPTVWTTKAVQERLNDKIVEVIQSITMIHQRQQAGVSSSLTSRGIFYPREYYKILEQTNQDDTLSQFVRDDVFYNGRLDPKYFMHIPVSGSPSGMLPKNFALVDGASPVDALRSIRQSISVIGCGEVCQVAQYEAVLEVIGPEKFNAIFAATSSQDCLMIGSGLNDNPIGRLRTYFLEENPRLNTLKKGDMVVFQNVPEYSTKHLEGEAANYNTICVDVSDVTPRFTTLGLPSQGLTRPEMLQTLLKDYNQPPASLECMSQKTKSAFEQRLGADELARTSEYAASQLSMEEFLQEGGGKTKLLCELDAEKITLLANATIPEARRLLHGFKARKAKRV